MKNNLEEQVQEAFNEEDIEVDRRMQRDEKINKFLWQFLLFSAGILTSLLIVLLMIQEQTFLENNHVLIGFVMGVIFGIVATLFLHAVYLKIQIMVERR